MAERLQADTAYSEREICGALSLSRATKRYVAVKRADEDELTAAIIDLATNYGRYGYRRIATMLRTSGFENVNHKRVERIWREQGLKGPARQPKRRRIWTGAGSCIQLRPERQDHVWSYDFVEDGLENGRRIRWLNVIDEYDRRLVACVPRRSWRGNAVIDVLRDAFLAYGFPECIRSDNGSGFIACPLREFLSAAEVKTLYIEPGSPWKMGIARASIHECVMNP